MLDRFDFDLVITLLVYEIRIIVFANILGMLLSCRLYCSFSKFNLMSGTSTDKDYVAIINIRY
jgi:hypothetical protein